MISSQLHHELSGTDDVVRLEEVDFSQTGLKLSSVIRATRLAIVTADMLQGAIGSLPARRLDRIRRNIARWISGVTIESVPSGKVKAEHRPGGDA